MSSSRSARRTATVLASLSWFVNEEGLVDSWPLEPEMLEAFCATTRRSWATSTRGTYRSVLRRAGGLAPDPGRSVAHGGAAAPAPYTSSERSELWSVAASQRAQWRRQGAFVLLALGLGAGLRAGEITAATGADVRSQRGVTVLDVAGTMSRTVVVQGPSFASLLGATARRSPSAHLFHPGEADRRYPNFINDFCRYLVVDPTAAKLSSSRARSSFICDHLAQGTELSVLLEHSGIKEVESLLRYARHAPGAPQSKAELRRVLANGRRR